jgi:hypothetical protein
MKKASPPIERIIVHSDSEIPLFSSEDEEREWWETHDLGEEFLPRYEHLDSLLFMGSRASEAPQVEFPLALARRSLRTMRRPARRRGYLYDRKVQDAVSAITFAAAALEAGLNLYYATAPQQAKTSKRKMAGTSVAKMLDHLLSTEEERPSPALVARLRQLLRRRDIAVQGLAPVDDSAPSGTPGDWDIENAPVLVEAAESFLDQLWLSARGKIARGFHNKES